MLKECTVLKKVSIHFTRKDEDADDEFKAEIKFYTKMKSKEKSKQDKYEKT